MVGVQICRSLFLGAQEGWTAICTSHTAHVLATLFAGNTNRLAKSDFCGRTFGKLPASHFRWEQPVQNPPQLGAELVEVAVFGGARLAHEPCRPSSYLTATNTRQPELRRQALP